MKEIIIPGLSVERGAIPDNSLHAMRGVVKHAIAALGGIYYDSGTGFSETAQLKVHMIRDKMPLPIAALIKYVDPYPKTLMLINQYVSRDVAGSFHADFASATVVHLHDGGIFDFAPDASTHDEVQDFESIELAAGDIVRCSLPELMHRGRSATEQVRNNVIFLEAPNQLT